MKKLNRIIWLTLTMFQLTLLRSQVPACLIANPNANSTQASCPFEGICYMSQFIPNQFTNTVFVRVNFWFLKPSSNPNNPGVWNNVTQQGVDTLLAYINRNYDSLYAPKLKFYPTPQYIKKSKIKFVLNSFNLVVDSLLYNLNDGSGFGPLYAPYVSSPNAIDIVYKTAGSVFGYGAAGNIPSKIIKLVYQDPSAPNSWQPSGLEAGILTHELGHCMGLYHTGPGGPGSSFFANPSGVPNDSCWFQDWKDEDNTIWNVIANCINPLDTTHSNNIMGYNGCNHYLSPNQLAACWYSLFNHPPLTACIVNPQVFLNPQPVCAPVNSLYNILITSNTTWNVTKNIQGNVIVKPGNTLIINCKQLLPKDAKIIVEQGARLIVNDMLTSYCNDPWHGIEVWGSYVAQQDSIGQGVLYLNNASITNARYGVTTGKRLGNYQVDLSTTGGIVKANFSAFVGNKNDVEFYPYLLQTFNNTNFTAPVNNVSYFADCSFTGDRNLANELKDQCIYMDGVYNIKILRCRFNLDPNDGPTYSGNNNAAVGIHAYKSNFRLIGTSSISYVRNFLHGVVVENANGGFPVVIDNMKFLYNKSNHVVILSSVGSRITNNQFSLLNTNIPTDPMTGIYLFESTNYQVENNKFIGNALTNQIGMYVRNSGPYQNAIYNNTFQNLQQGLWSVGKNWDDASGVGLKMNCNDFTNSTYNIGVVDLPYAIFGVDWTGVDRVQGLAFTANNTDKVRNTYAVVACVGNNENKFRMDALNNNTNNYFYIQSHGSFATPASSQPNPQTLNSCSNNSEEVLLSQGSAPGSKPIYCPNNSLPLLSKQQLLIDLSTTNVTLSQIQSDINTKIDGGNKKNLLQIINGGGSNGQIKNQLMAVGPYLSDEVMKAYFNSGAPAGHKKLVFVQNAPVSPTLWNYIQTLNLPTGILNEMNSAQNTNTISGTNDLLSKKTFYLHKQQEINFERFERFLHDSTGFFPDSVINFLNSGVLPNSDLLLADYYHILSAHSLANSTLDQIAIKGGAFTDYATLKRYLWNIDADPAYIDILRTDAAKKLQIVTLTHSGSYLTEGMARTLLSQVWNIFTPLEKPVPNDGTGTGARGGNTDTQTKEIVMNEYVKIFPNPASTFLTVRAENNDSKQVQILDLNGKIVVTHDLEITSTIDIRNLTNGVYFIRLVNGDKVNSINKIIIIK